QIAPIAPVKVIRRGSFGLPSVLPSFRSARRAAFDDATLLTVRRGAWRIMEGSDTDRKRDIVAYAPPRTQGADRPIARATGSVSVFQRGGGHHIRRKGPRAPGPGAQLSWRVRVGSEDGRAPDRSGAARGDHHRLGGRGAGA